jgi:hypothetical protein
MITDCKKYNGCRLPTDLCNEDCKSYIDTNAEYPYDIDEERKIEDDENG